MDFPNFFKGEKNNSSKSNDTKNHYFISAVIDNESMIEKIKLVRKKLINKYSVKELHYPNLISTNLIYLGYFDVSVADLYMNKIISYLCKSVINKFGSMECNLTNFKMTYDKKYYRIMLQLEDSKSYLKKYIIPYLHKNGVEKIYGSKKFESKASIDVIYFKESKKIESQKQKFGRKFKIMLDYPTDKFIINKLSLIKGSPLVSRSGTPSTHDQMDFEVVKDYQFDFSGNNNVGNNVPRNNNMVNNAPRNNNVGNNVPRNNNMVNNGPRNNNVGNNVPRNNNMVNNGPRNNNMANNGPRNNNMGNNGPRNNNMGNNGSRNNNMANNDSRNNNMGNNGPRNNNLNSLINKN